MVNLRLGCCEPASNHSESVHQLKHFSTLRQTAPVPLYPNIIGGRKEEQKEIGESVLTLAKANIPNLNSPCLSSVIPLIPEPEGLSALC